MKKHYRPPITIVYEMLAVCSEDVLIHSAISRKVNISHYVGMHFIKQAIKNELLETIPKERFDIPQKGDSYMTTRKGVEFMKTYDHLITLIGEPFVFKLQSSKKYNKVLNC